MGLARVRAVLVVVALTAFATTTMAGGTPAVAAATAPAAAFRPITPCRLLDTRISHQRLPATGTIDVDVAGRCGLSGDAVAAAVTITAVTPAAVGFVSAYPIGERRPDTSVLNYRAGEVVANLQLLRLGDGGIRLFSLAAADLVVDVSGVFVPVKGGSTTAGRYVPIVTERVTDTRSGARPSARDVVRVATGLPDGASAAAVNITTTDSRGPDFLTAYPAGARRPNTSVLNVDRSGQTRAAAAIVPIVDGKFDVFTRFGNHVIVDVVGYFTGTTDPKSSDGLFVAASPTRLVDTRLPAGRSGGPRLWDHGAREFDVETVTGGPVSAVAVNVTVTETEDAGFVVVHPARTPAPGTSTVNYSSAGLTTANQALVRVSGRGITATAVDATHLVMDVTGWFTGDPVPADGAAAVNRLPALRDVTIIGDSAFAGIRWNGTVGGLRGMNVDHRLDSCRRLVQPSCRGREGFVPRTVQSEIGFLPPTDPEDILVITAGYDDWYERFSADFDTVVATARAKGFHHIVWVTYRSHVGYRQPGGGQSNYGAMNAIMWAKVASGAFPDVRIWDLRGLRGLGRRLVLQRRHPRAPDRFVGDRRLDLAARRRVRRPAVPDALGPGRGDRKSLRGPRSHRCGARRSARHRRPVRPLIPAASTIVDWWSRSDPGTDRSVAFGYADADGVQELRESYLPER